MKVHRTRIHQASSSDSVLGEESFGVTSSFTPKMPVSTEILTGSSPYSRSETLTDHSLVPSLAKQGVSSLSLPAEAQEGQIIAPSASNSKASPPNSISETLDGHPLVPSLPNANGSFTSKTMDESLVETPGGPPITPLVPQSSTLDGSYPPMPAAEKDNKSDKFCNSDREAQEEPEPSSTSRLLNDLSDYPSSHCSSPWLSEWSSHTSGPLSSSKEWSPWPSSSSRFSKEEASDFGLSPEESWLTSRDNSTPSTNTFAASPIVSSMVGAGLANLGNTCFLNAILQCFTHTVPLIRGLRSCSHSTPCDGGIDRFCVLCALRDHIENSLATSGRILSPWNLVDNLNHFSSVFGRYQQEDAHEFMQCVLDKLEQCFLDGKKKNNKCERDENLVQKIFGGSLISKLRCCNCGHCSDTNEPLIDLSLEIENVNSLTSALESFTKVEKIDTEFRCDSCKEQAYMEKQLVLDQTPSVAVFHLKRFKTDGAYVEKIENHLEFPLELDLQPYTSCNQSSNVALKYDLYAVVVHVGFASTSGHYFCFVRSAPDMWHRMDDSKVTRVLGDSVMSQEAYILFYTRQGTQWFSSIMDCPRPCLDPSILGTSPKSVLDNADSMYNPRPSIANIASCDAGESKKFDEQMSDNGCRRRQEEDGLEVNGTVDGSRGLDPFPSSSKQKCVGFNGCRDDSHHTPLPVGNNVVVNGNSYNVRDRDSTLSSLDTNNCHQEAVDIRENDGFHPLTPPSSPGPDAYSPGRSYRIPREHLKMENHESCKKPLSKSLEDSKRKEAVRYVSKSVPGSRRLKLMDALIGSHSEGSLNKKRKKMDSSPCKKATPPSMRKHSKHGSVMHPVAAGISR